MLRVAYVGFAILGTYLYLPHVAFHGTRLAKPSKRRLIVAEYALSLGTILLACRLLGAVWVAHYRLLPIVIASQVTSLRGLAEHGMTTAGDPFTASRTVVSTGLVSFLLLNLNYHMEHHLSRECPGITSPDFIGFCARNTAWWERRCIPGTRGTSWTSPASCCPPFARMSACCPPT